MASSMAGRLTVCVFLFVFVLHLPRVANAADAFVLSEVHVVGTDQLSSDDVIRGLHLKVGGQTSRRKLIDVCSQLRKLKLFETTRCTFTIHGNGISLTVFVKQAGMPVVFDNFVWISKPELVARLKREIPLFMPVLPQSNGLTNDIIRVLQEVVSERGLDAPVRYDAHFWTNRGMNVFYVESISTPIKALQIEGTNAPSPEETLRFSNFYTKENFSAARLTWVVRWVIRDLYKSRGYLRAVAADPVIHFLGEKDGSFPVQVVLPISSGDLYVFDSVKFDGLATTHAASLVSNWNLKRGEPYNESYVNEFISKEILAASWAVHSKTESDVALPCVRIDATSKQVSLTITVQVPRKTYTDTNTSMKHLNEECGPFMSQLTFSPVK